jgi:hypothetical protein
MSPESISRQEYSEKSDVWAYGSTLIEMLTGREPYPGMQIMDIAVGVRDNKFSALDFLPETVVCPDFIREILGGCFKTDPDERPSFNDICQIWNKHCPPGMLIEYDEEDKDQESNYGNFTSKTNKTNKTNKTSKSNKTKTNEGVPPQDNTTNKTNKSVKTNKKSKGQYEEVMPE